MKKVLTGWFGKRWAVNGPKDVEQILRARNRRGSIFGWDEDDWPPVKCKVTLEWDAPKGKKGAK